MDVRNVHLVLLLDTLLAAGRGAASRAGVGVGRAADGVGWGRDSRGRGSRGRGDRGRNSRNRGVRETAGGDGLGQAVLVEILEPLLGDLRVLLQQLALDALLDQGLLLDFVDRGVEDVSLQSEGLKSVHCFRHGVWLHPLVAYLATAEPVHTRSHSGEAVEAHADGLAALLLRQNVVLLLFSIGQAGAVSVRAVDSGRRRAGVVGGRHFRD